MSNPHKFVLVAYNIHTGGGLTLLKSILSGMQFASSLQKIFYFDARFNYESKDNNEEINYVKPALISRFRAEFSIWRGRSHNATYLFFGNLPPLFPLDGRIFVYVQNRFLIEKHLRFRQCTGVKFFIRTHVERLWLRIFLRPNHVVLVQTPLMQELAKRRLRREGGVHVAPFLFADEVVIARKWKLLRQPSDKRQASIVIPISGEVHKNHQTVISALGYLSRAVQFTIAITLNDRFFSRTIQCYREAAANLRNINVVNLGVLDTKALKQQIYISDIVVYPSTYEAFGLPLMESAALNRIVIAPKVDYVIESGFYTDTFSPYNPTDLAEVVNRWINNLTVVDANRCTAQIQSAHDFLKNDLLLGNHLG